MPPTVERWPEEKESIEERRRDHLRDVRSAREWGCGTKGGEMGSTGGRDAERRAEAANSNGAICILSGASFSSLPRSGRQTAEVRVNGSQDREAEKGKNRE